MSTAVDRPAAGPATRGDQLLSGWGRTGWARCRLRRLGSGDELAGLLGAAPPAGTVARGMGRSYGDAAQIWGGLVLDMTAMAEIGWLDPHQGTITAGAGTTLGRIVAAVLPWGWLPHALPGTRHVTLGGAIAADVHGKDHLTAGSFCRHVERIRLATPAGITEISPRADAELFWATAGGMGLTGVILEATIRLRRVGTGWLQTRSERAGDLDDLLERLDAAARGSEYSVAWVDGMARGRSLGRGVVTAARHAGVDEVEGRAASDLASSAVPRRPVASALRCPLRLLPGPLVRAFNAAVFRRAASGTARLQRWDDFFHPLDRVAGWNHLYGRRGLLQYQFAVPLGRADVLASSLSRLHEADGPPFLATLKRFGPATPAPLSFPIPGWTLALDLPADSPGASVLARLDELVVEAGGRVYLAKDARLRPGTVAAMYPRVGEWRLAKERVDPALAFRSDLSVRLALTEPNR